jgi:hypothetical protein
MAKIKIVNRGFIHLSPTPIFMDWAKKHAEETPFFDQSPEATTYLIEEEFWEEEKVLEKYFKKIFTQESMAFSADKEVWLPCEQMEEFLTYFSVNFGTFVYDLLPQSLTSEAIDF